MLYSINLYNKLKANTGKLLLFPLRGHSASKIPPKDYTKEALAITRLLSLHYSTNCFLDPVI